MALPNPNRSLITDELWNFGQVCLEREPGTTNAGIYASKPGFHNTVRNNQRNWPGNYSIALPTLVQPPHDKARAFDWLFPEAQRGDYARINLYSQRLMEASLRKDPRLVGLYEWFGTDSGRNIGFNVWKDRPSSSDDSHDYHIHFSFVTPVVTAWSFFINLLSVLFPGEDDMELIKKIQQALADAGFDPGPVDGEWGPRTHAAFAAALRSTGPKGDKGDPGVKGDKGDPGTFVGSSFTAVGTFTQA